MPIKTGTRQLDIQRGAKVDPKSKGGLRTMRCKKCGGQAVEAPNGKGGRDLKCPNCKTVYAFSRL